MRGQGESLVDLPPPPLLRPPIYAFECFVIVYDFSNFCKSAIIVIVIFHVPAVEPADVEEVGRDATGEAAGDCSSGTMGDSSGSSPVAT